MENINSSSVDTSQNNSAPEVSVESNTEKSIDKSIELPVISTEEKLTNIESVISSQETQIAKLAESNKNTETALENLRKELGLPEDKEKAPSLLSGEERMKKLQDDKKDLESQKEEIISQQEKEKLINEEKEKILQEKFDELFKEFKNIDPKEFESIFNTGKKISGDNFDSKSTGLLSPEHAKVLASVYEKGIVLLPKIIEIIPELIKKMEKDLTKEATERVERKIEEGKKDITENKNLESTQELKNENEIEIEKSTNIATSEEIIQNVDSSVSINN
ncbi:MAG: hypothetical protein WCO35_04050 [Candidatus Nomurabacteria bacterium]